MTTDTREEKRPSKGDKGRRIYDKCPGNECPQFAQMIDTHVSPITLKVGKIWGAQGVIITLLTTLILAVFGVGSYLNGNLTSLNDLLNEEKQLNLIRFASVEQEIGKSNTRISLCVASHNQLKAMHERDMQEIRSRLNWHHTSVLSD